MSERMNFVAANDVTLRPGMISRMLDYFSARAVGKLLFRGLVSREFLQSTWRISICDITSTDIRRLRDFAPRALNENAATASARSRREMLSTKLKYA